MNADAFHDAILHEPDEVAHRLVFADWLEDSDRPERAELIRLQIERYGFPAVHPRARRNMRRENELLDLHGAEWAGRIAAFTLSRRFHRGFVEEVSMQADQFLAHGAELFALAPVHRLHLRGIGSLPQLLQSTRAAKRFADLLARIRTLDLNREYLNDATGQALLMLPRPPRLLALHLTQNALSLEGFNVLASSSVLETLSVLEVTPSPDALAGLLNSPHLSRLKQLSLGGSTPGPRLTQVLLRSPVLERLTALSLRHANLTAGSLRDLVSHPAARNLESLEVSFNPLGLLGARALVESERLEKLGFLNLSGTHLADDGLAALAESPLLGRLWGIDLSLNRAGPSGGLALAARTQGVRLESLDLIYNNGLGDEARDALRERYGDDVCLFHP